jgi:DNA-binding IclR family transcriptional regulator
VSQSLARALQILIRLGEGPASLDQLAAAVDVHKSTVLRLLRTLAEEHFVVRDASHRYFLGSRVFELSSRALDQREVRRIAAPHLASLNRQLGRTVHLAVLEDGAAVYIDKLDSHDPIRMVSRIGLRPPLHSSAVGKVLLAGLPEHDRRDVVSQLDLAPATPNTITEPERLLAELERVRRRGWARDREENEPSVNCIAAPIRGASGATVAACSISVPNVVMTYRQLHQLLPALLDVTARISRDLGWQPTRTDDKEPSP